MCAHVKPSEMLYCS